MIECIAFSISKCAVAILDKQMVLLGWFMKYQMELMIFAWDNLKYTKPFRKKETKIQL
jgi:hypothetical protein